jgi:hypothetical protein
VAIKLLCILEGSEIRGTILIQKIMDITIITARKIQVFTKKVESQITKIRVTRENITLRSTIFLGFGLTMNVLATLIAYGRVRI